YRTGLFQSLPPIRRSDHPSQKIMHRPTVGVLAILLLLAGGVIYFGGLEEGKAGLFQAACLRIGAILATLWVAHPELSRMRPWMITVLVAALIGIVFV